MTRNNLTRIANTDNNVNNQRVIRPSLVTDSRFDCFKKKGLHFVHLNARSIFHKVSELKLIARQHKIAVFSITETWLDNSYTDQSIKIEGYNLIRRDRDTFAGGVCIYIREDLAFNPRQDLQNINFEDVWVEILLPRCKPIIIGTCYKAPDNNNLTECLENTLNLVNPESDIYVLGDFNICLLKDNSNYRKSYKDLTELHNFKQLINKPTRVTDTSASCIDHIFVNKSEKVCQAGIIESGISDHFITYCTRKINTEVINKHNTVNARSMKNYDSEIFIEKLKVLDWENVFISSNVNDAWDSFKKTFLQIIDDIAPVKEVRIKGRTEQWMTSDILELIYERDRILTLANKNRSVKELRKQYNELRNKVIDKVREAKANYFSEKVEEHKNNPKSLWKQFKSLGYSNKNKEKSRIVIEIDNVKCFDPKKVAQHMCNFFINIATILKNKLPAMPNLFDISTHIFKDFYTHKVTRQTNLTLSRVTEEYVYKELCKLNSQKSTGIDEISPIFLKDGANELKGVLTYIINLSIDTKTVPDEMKFAKVKPLFKKGSRLDASNYRPVSILPIVSKILERAVYKQVVDYLDRNNLLYENQSGFRKAYSTDTCLINLTDQIKLDMSKGLYVGMVLIDLQKAFDTVDHEILCNKLKSMGINSTEWFQSYLGGRNQVVEANDTLSEAGIVNCGVPQGSILGPLLFLCYINDMPMSLKCKLLLYADDSALLISGKEPNKIAEELSKELSSCRNWLIDNKLSLHLGKTEAILFGTRYKLNNVNSFEVICNNEVIQNVKNVKYLGLQLDEELSGESIVKEITKKVNSRLRFLYRYKDYLTTDSRKTLCTALIQCHFDYSCSSWFPGINKGLSDKLQVLQNRMIRFILKLDSRHHIGYEELKESGFLRVSERVKQLKLGHIFKIRNKTCPNYMNTNFKLLNENVNRSSTRSYQYNFFLPSTGSQGTKTFFYTGINDWNSLPNNIKEIKNEDLFKKKVKEHLMMETKNEELKLFTK